MSLEIVFSGANGNLDAGRIDYEIPDFLTSSLRGLPKVVGI
jgi:hypothetical protein